MKNNIKYLVLHCSAVGQDIVKDQFKSINNYHRDVRLFPRSVTGNYHGYHRLITGDKVYKCKEDWEVGVHCNDLVDGISMNFQSIAVCIGFDGDIEYPSETHRMLLRQTLDELMRQYSIGLDRVVFHRDFNKKGKTCPGSLFTREYLLSIIKPVEKEVVKEKCNDANAIIATQKKQITNLQTLLDSLIKFFYKK